MSKDRKEPLRSLAAALGAAGLALSCVACSAGAPTAPAGHMTVTDVLDGAAGRTVTVTGRYAGWTGGCKGGPPNTRSDWMLVDDTSCIYVSGPVPAGLVPPPDTASNGTPVEIRAQVERAADGRLFLRLPRR